MRRNSGENKKFIKQISLFSSSSSRLFLGDLVSKALNGINFSRDLVGWSKGDLLSFSLIAQGRDGQVESRAIEGPNLVFIPMPNFQLKVKTENKKLKQEVFPHKESGRRSSQHFVISTGAKLQCGHKNVTDSLVIN